MQNSAREAWTILVPCVGLRLS